MGETIACQASGLAIFRCVLWFDFGLCRSNFVLLIWCERPVRVPFICNIACAIIRLKNFKQAHRFEQRGKIFHSIIARINWRLAFGGAAGGGHCCPAIIANRGVDCPSENRDEFVVFGQIAVTPVKLGLTIVF